MLKRSQTALHSPKRSEKAFQEQLCELLSRLGYSAIEIGKTRRAVACPKCGQRFHPTGWQGNSTSAPDVLASHDDWPVGVSLSFELKMEDGAVRPDQRVMIERKRAILARSIETVLRAVLDFEETLWDGGDNGAKLRRERLMAFLKMNEGRLQ